MTRFYPALFVFLWSTGFIGAKYGLPYADPLSFLLIRYVCVIALMSLAAVAVSAPWPKTWQAWFHLVVTGVLMQGFYLGGVFMAIGKGLPAGMVSLLVGLQPILTALFSGLVLAEVVRVRQWLGLALGIIGTVMVLSGRIDSGFTLSGIMPALFALFAITLGSLYQKRFCPHFDWRTGSAIQFFAAAVITLPVVLIEHNFRVQFTSEFFFALGWLVLVLSLGAVSLLNHLIRHGSAVNVASLFYLVPPLTALIAWGLFGETFSSQGLVGLAIAVTGVALVRRS